MPRIVKISDLDEEQKKKWIEQVNNRYQERIENQQLEQQRANELFNQLNPPVETKVKKMETYNTIKRNAMKETGEQIKQQNEIKRQEQEALNKQIKEQAEKINSDFNKNNPTTVNLPTEDNNKKSTSINLPTVRLATEEERNSFKEANNGEIFKLTNGEVDDRNNIQKKIGNVTAPIGNLVLGAVQGLQNTKSYTQATGKFGAKKMGATLLDYLINNKEVSESVSDTIVNILESNNKDFQKFNKEKEIVSNEIQFNTKKPTNYGSQKLTELAPSIGSNIVSGLVAAENPLAGAALFMTSAGGSYLEEGKQRGMNDDQALGYATVMGIVEGGSEALISGKMASNLLKATTGKELSKAYLNSLKNDLIENFIQESATTWINEGTAKAFGGESDWGNWEKIAKDSLQDGIDGVLSALILQGTYSGISSSQIAMNKINNGQQLTQQEIENVIKDLKEKEPEKYKQTINGAISALVEKNEARNQTLSLDNIEQQQTTQNSNKTAQNGTSTQISELLNNKVAPMQNYQYEKTENEKVNKFNENASRFFTNSEKSRNYLEMLKQIIIDKDVDIVFDPNLKDSNGNMANGSYSNGVITINPNSTRAGEFIAIHELTHAIGTNSMRNIIEQYRKSNAEFNKAVNDLLQNYKSNELTDEAMADVAGQLFGNQEFINNLAQTNPNMFKKIYNEIKYLWHQFTGYKNQDQFIQDLQYKWEQAYRSNAKLNEASNYSIAGIEAKNNAIKNDKHFKIIEDAYNLALQKDREGKSNKEILRDTNWYKDANGDWKFEFSDSDMELKKINFVSDRIYKLKDVLDHDILYLYYPELKEYNVVFKNKRTGGSYNESEKLIAIGNNKINNPKEIKGTLIHEIQHAIQNIEGYSTGTTSKKGWFRYLNTLGEIEAADTKDRYLNGYKGMPETAKEKPIHPIIKNSNNIIEKIGNSLYNYFNGGLNYGKENKSNDEENTSRNKNVVELGERSINEVENSNKSSFSMDNQGRKLSKEQQDYFKNSKVRDNNGNLLTMYHSTDADFNTFSYDNLGKTGLAYGQGFYFTDSENAKNAYGKNTKTVYLDIQKPMEIGKRTMSENDYRKLVVAVNDITNGQVEADYGSIDDAVQDYQYGGDDIDLINGLKYESGLSNKSFYELLRDTLGYDGIKANNKTNGQDGNYWIAFNSNQIKNIENVNPTTNPDIRFSKNNEKWEQFLNNNFNSEDNQGRKLSKEQQNFFKNSKARNNKGQLETVYHGSNSAGFTEFNRNFNYFTNNEEMAKSYTRGTEMVDTKKLQSISDAKSWLKGITDEAYINNTTVYNEYGKKLLTYDSEQDLLRNLKRDIQKEFGNLDAGGTYEGYVNIENPVVVNANGDKWSMIGIDGISIDGIDDIKKFLNDYGASVWSEKGKLRTSTNDIVVAVMDAIEDGKIEADGVIIKDVYDEGGYGSTTPNEKGTDYITFKSNQFKALDNSNPTLDSDIRYSKDNKNWREYLEKNFKSSGTKTNLNEIKIPIEKKQEVKIPTQEYFENKEKIDLLTDEDYEVLNKIYEKEGKTEILSEKKKANLLEKYANDKFTIKDSLDILAQKFINKGHYVDKLAERTGNLDLKYIYDRNLNSFAEGQYEIGVAQTDNNGKNIGKSINDIWKPVEDAKLSKEFSEYLLHKHNIDRSGRGKYIFGEEIGPTESTAIALQYEKEHPEFIKYAKDIKKFNHNNLESLKEAGMLTQDTIDYIEAMYPNYIAVSRNMEDQLYTGSNDKTGTGSPLKKATGGNSDIQPIKDTMAQQAIKIKRLINQNKLGQELAKTLNNAQVEEGVDVELSPTMLLDMETMVDTDTQGNKYYIYFKDGKQQKLKINDSLYESLKPTEISKLEKTLPFKIIQKATNIQRSLLTSSNPIFVVTNFFKDFQDGMFNSKYSSKFIKNYGKALNEIYTKGKYYQSYMANGGMSNTYFDYDEGIKKKSNKFVEKIRNVNEIVEQLPRLAEFISTIEDGKSLNEALYNAAEITTNFKRGGDITKALNRNGVNFLNASIQGLDKQFRNFSGQKGAKGFVNLLAKAAIMGIAPAILNHILLDDDEDYQDLPESTKDLYYLFKYADGKFIRIPKGRVLSIFGAAARRTLEATQGQEDAFEGLGETIVNQIAPNNPLEDNILAPIVQVKNNKTWYGSDLVSSRLQKELPENQYDETTDEFSKWLGKQLKVSPKKVNYLIDQYSGGIGDVILPMITPQAKQNVLVDKFTTDSVLKNKNVSKFYTTLERQQQIVNDSFSTDEDSIQLKYLNSISSEMSKLYKEKRNIQMSNISNDNKTKQVREIQQQIDGLAEKGLSNYKQVKMNKNSAKIGDQEYYKNGNGTWTLLDSEEKNKVGNLSLDTYSDYKQKVYNETQTKRDSGELSKTQELKTKDKIDILLNSKYSDSQIKNIYETLIKSSKDTEYDIIDNTGINIKEYLRYKQQEFESDKKDDGTTTGKTVSGSKKTKVYNYVNNMDISYNQKLLLLGMQYSLTNTEKTKLANYVNNLNINKQEKLNIFEKLSGFTVYKDGRVTW